MTDLAPPIRVAIIEDQREIREGLKVLVSGTPGHRVTGAWRSMEEALVEIVCEVPDIVLVDIGLPGMPGFSDHQEQAVLFWRLAAYRPAYADGGPIFGPGKWQGHRKFLRGVFPGSIRSTTRIR